MAPQSDLFGELDQEGYLVLRKVLDPMVIVAARCQATKDLGSLEFDSLGYPYALGIDLNLPLYHSLRSTSSELWPRGWDLHSASLITKRPRENRRQWHQDLLKSKGRVIGFLHYLQKTDQFNGCLLVLPRFRVPEFGEIGGRFQAQPDEVPVPVEVGDVVVLDSTTFHASLPNRSNQERLLITVWVTTYEHVD